MIEINIFLRDCVGLERERGTPFTIIRPDALHDKFESRHKIHDYDIREPKEDR